MDMMRDAETRPSKNRRGRGYAASTTLLIGVLLLLTVGCYVLRGWRATTANPGLGVADLVAALPADRGWEPWPGKRALGEGRMKQARADAWVTVSLVADPKLIVVWLPGHPRRALDDAIAELSEARPDLGPWKIEDLTSARPGGRDFVLAVAGLILGGVLLLAAALRVFVVRRDRRLRDAAAEA